MCFFRCLPDRVGAEAAIDGWIDQQRPLRVGEAPGFAERPQRDVRVDENDGLPLRLELGQRLIEIVRELDLPGENAELDRPMLLHDRDQSRRRMH